MTDVHNDQTINRPFLHPYQEELTRVILKGVGSTVVLKAYVGSGKSRALACSVARLMALHPNSRVLILCPAAIRQQWEELVTEEGVTALIVDRFEFRKLLSAAQGDEIRPANTTFIVSDDFAKLPDIQEAFIKFRWDLVIVDEAHRFSGARSKFLGVINDFSDRVVLAAIPQFILPKDITFDKVEFLEWDRERVVSALGLHSADVRLPLLHLHSYELTLDEQELWDLVQEIVSFPEFETNPSRRERLIRQLYSSPAVLEKAIQGLCLGPVAHVLKGEASDDTDLDASMHDQPFSGKTKYLLEKALANLDAISVDSKMDALVATIASLRARPSSNARVCIAVKSLATQFYLEAALNDSNVSHLLINKQTRLSKRVEILKAFETGHHVLLSTEAILNESLDIPDVSDIFLYELPSSHQALQGILARFDRIGRSERLVVHALIPAITSVMMNFESASLVTEYFGDKIESRVILK